MDEDEIKEAIWYIKSVYHRVHKIRPIISYDESIDEVQYLLFDCWCDDKTNPKLSKARLVSLCRIIHRACNKFPDAAYAVAKGIVDKIPYDSISTPELCWMAGYFTSICDQHEAWGYIELDIDSTEMKLPVPMENVDIDLSKLKETLQQIRKEMEDSKDEE